MKVAGIIQDSLCNGEGIRMVIFFQGCNHRCEGCHNQHTWDKNGGKEMSVDELLEIVKRNKLIKGVTLSGGEPLMQTTEELFKLTKGIKELGLNIWCYTGHEIEEWFMPVLRRLNIDIIVDGRFEKDKMEGAKKYTGSSNQRIIDVEKSFKQNKIIEYM